MKVYKKKELSLSLTPFNIAGRQYLSFAVMTYFDLTAPDDLLTDQDLWRDVPDQLGATPILDTGMPKQRAELLVAGSCFAPRGKTIPATQVRVRVGDVEKTLEVFGNRWFKLDGSISEPRPFVEMPIVFENAYGGEGFSQNPVGKGYTMYVDENGETYRPLPNIEHPSRTIGATYDQPDPAGLRMIDVTWEPRASKTGTYDDNWLADRWPNLPMDIDHSFFNTAQADQWADTFFTGDEVIEIDKMHPDLRRIISHLPGVRIRLFPTLITNFKPFRDKSQDKEEFIEAPTRLDTVWLFPSILRGLCIHRASVPNHDDEYADVSRVYLDFERLSDPPLPIEEYLERQRKAMDLSIPIDMAPFEAASKDIGQAMKTLKNSPKEVARVKKAILGQEPAMPRTADEMVTMGQRVADGNFKTLDQLEKVAKDLHGQFGHMVKIDLTVFDRMRAKVQETMAGARKTAEAIKAGQAKAEATKKAVLEKANASLDTMTDPEFIRSKGIDPELVGKHIDMSTRFSLPEGTGNPWHDSGFPFVIACRRALENDFQVQDALHALGLPDRVIRRAWLGINPSERLEDPVAWGLAKPPAPGAPAPAPLRIPAGLILPRFDGPTLNRILVRAGYEDCDFDHFLTETLVQGSAELPLALPPPEPGGYWVRVADELQALFMEEEIGDACGVVAMSDAGQAPDDATLKAIAEKDVFLIVMPDGTTNNSAAWAPWPQTFKNARLLTLPKGNSVFEARAAGVDVRALVMEALPPDFAEANRIEATLPEAGKAPTASPVPPLKFPTFDFKKDAADLRATLEARLQPQKDKLLAMKADMDSQFDATLAKLGKTRQEYEALAKAEAAVPFPERNRKMIEAMVEERKRLKATGAMTPEMEKSMDKALAEAKKSVSEANTIYERDMARIAQSEKQFAQAREQIAARKLPGGASEEMAAAGLDPELLRPMTREEVVERYERGLPFAKRTLSGLDLSRLELPGIDLSEAILVGTNFSETDLRGARLFRAIAQEADFTKARLGEANLEMGVFIKAKLKKADLDGARMRQTLFQEADLTEVSFRDAKLDMALIQNCKLEKADFSGSSLYLTLVHASDMPEADFRDAMLKKSLLRELDCSKVRFDRSRLDEVMFQGTKGTEVSFRNADLTRFRTSGETSLPGADFRNACLREACLRETALPDADFIGADLTSALFEYCDLSRVNMRNVPARGASFLKCDLAAAKLHGLNLMTGSLRKSRVTEADLGWANLFATDMYKMIVGRTNFSDANLTLTALHRKTDLIR